MKCGGGTFHFAHPGAQKCDLGSPTDPYATESCQRLRILSRFACRPSDEATLPQAIPTRRCAEGVFIHTRRGAVNRPLAVTWYATGVGSVCRIASRSRWVSSERALRFSHHTQKSVVGGRCSEKTAPTLNAQVRFDQVQKHGAVTYKRAWNEIFLSSRYKLMHTWRGADSFKVKRNKVLFIHTWRGAVNRPR